MRHRMLSAVVVSALLATAGLAGACGTSTDKSGGAGTPGPAKAGTIVVGGLNFSESAILANMYAKALEAAGKPVKLRLNLGSREVVEPALEKGEIDLYPTYAATELEFLNKGTGEASPDVAVTVSKLRNRYQSRGVTVLTPSPAVDSNAFAVSRETADRLNLHTLSELAPVAGQLVLGGPPECPTRPFCQAGLARVYGLQFKSFKALDAGGPLSKTALANGDVDVALIFSSDGAIPAKGFVVLDDDKHLQNSDNVVPVGRSAVLVRDVAAVLDRVSAALTTDDLAALNKRADVDKEDPDRLAAEWLRSHGLAKQ